MLPEIAKSAATFDLANRFFALPPFFHLIGLGNLSGSHLLEAQHRRVLAGNSDPILILDCCASSDGPISPSPAPSLTP